MIIQCPACGLQAKLPDSKEGAKVRCSECERVYVARPAGARGRAKRSNATIPILVGAGVLVLAIVLFGVMGGDGPNRNVRGPDVKLPDIAEEGPVVDPSGWDSRITKAARRIHDLAWQRSEFDLQGTLSMPHVWAWKTGTEDAPVDPSGYDALGADERSAFIADVVSELTADDETNLVGQWQPLDGKVLEQSDEGALVQLELGPRDKTEAGIRGIHWHMIEDGARWRAAKWERWISDAERKAMLTQVESRVEKKELSDGSLVLESEPRILGHHEDTPPELRARIDELVETFLDPNLPPRELTPVREELKAIGKPVTPILITELYKAYESGVDDYESQVRVQATAQMLEDITGYQTTTKLTAMGGTEERLESGVKQWFYWYDKKYKRFDGIDEEDTTDGLEAITDLDDLTDRERRDYEKAKRELEQEERELERERNR